MNQFYLQDECNYVTQEHLNGENLIMKYFLLNGVLQGLWILYVHKDSSQVVETYALNTACHMKTRLQQN